MGAYLTYPQIIQTFNSLLPGQAGYSFYVAQAVYDTYTPEGGMTYSGYPVVVDTQITPFGTAIQFCDVNTLNTLHYNGALALLNTTTTQMQTIQAGSTRQYTPQNSNDPYGSTGQIVYDSSYIYVKTGSGWIRATASSF